MTARASAILDDGPYSADDLVAMGFFASRSGATRFLSKRHARKELSFYGRHRPFGGTKPRYYYTAADLKEDDKAHEVLISTVHTLFFPRLVGFLRGPADMDPVRRQDFVAAFERGGVEALYDGELDRSTMSLGRMYRQRFAHYVGSERPLLVVTSGGETRMRNLMGVAEELADIAHFTTFERLRQDPFGRVWSGLDGETYALDV